MTGLSRKIASVEESQTLALTKIAKDLKASGVDVVSMTAGEPDFSTPEHVKKAAVEAIGNDFTHYTANAGIPELITAIREKFSRENGMEFENSQILVSSGAKHSIYNALQAICNPGDEVIIPAPYWVSYPEMAKMADAMPVILPTTRTSGYKANSTGLKGVVTSRSKALILNSPSNPSGSIYTRAELEALAPVIADAGLYVISDEIYEKVIYGGQKHASIGSLESIRDKVVSVNGVSKAFAMTGWRIGYMGGPKDLIGAAAKVQSQATSNANSIAQKAAVAALTGSLDDVARMVTEFKKRRDYLVDRLKNIPDLELHPPDGAFYAFPDLGAYTTAGKHKTRYATDMDLAGYLLKEWKLAVVPGTPFGTPGHLRLSYACSMTEVEKAADRLEQGLAKLRTN